MVSVTPRSYHIALIWLPGGGGGALQYMSTRHVPVDWPPFLIVQYPMTPFFVCSDPGSDTRWPLVLPLVPNDPAPFSQTISDFWCPKSIVITAYSPNGLISVKIFSDAFFIVPNDPLFSYYSLYQYWMTPYLICWYSMTPFFARKYSVPIAPLFEIPVGTYPSLFKWVPPPPGLITNDHIRSSFRWVVLHTLIWSDHTIGYCMVMSLKFCCGYLINVFEYTIYMNNTKVWPNIEIKKVYFWPSISFPFNVTCHIFVLYCITPT